MKKTVTGLLLFLVLCLIATGVPAMAEETEEKTVVMGMTNAWDTMMPMNTGSNYGRVIFNQVYDTLVSSLADGDYMPVLAKSWEVNEASDEITFTLHEDTTWHDGEKLTAEDVVFTFQLFSNPEITAMGRFALSNIAGTDDAGAAESENSIGVEAKDDHTIVIRLKQPMFFQTVFNDLDEIHILPKHLFKDYSIEELNTEEPWLQLIGSGPFKFEDKIEGERVELVANENYHLGAPKIDRLVIRVVPTQNMLSSLISGDIDIIAGGMLGTISLDDWALAQEQEDLEISSSKTSNYQILIVNSQKEYLTKPVRQAISMAINRDALVDALLQGEGEKIVTPISSISPYYNKEVEVWFDQEKAKELLEENDFDFDQELNFLVPSGNVTRERAAAIIQQNLEEIGMKVKIQTVDFSTLMEDMGEGKHDFGIIGSGGSLDPSESVQMIDPKSSYNFSLNDDPKFAELCDKGNAALTFDERYPFFAEYQEMVKDESKMIYLYTTNDLLAYNKRLVNVKVEDFATMTWNTWEWDIE